MAKGQQRKSKEARKPKADKKPAAGTGAATAKTWNPADTAKKGGKK